MRGEILPPKIPALMVGGTDFERESLSESAGFSLLHQGCTQK